MSKFTGQLQEDDLAYFRDWDRLIDLEAHDSNYLVATAWLTESLEREKQKGESVSRLEFGGAEPGQGSRVLIRFRRSGLSPSQSPLESLSIQKGCQVIISTDGTSFGESRPGQRPKARHHMHIVRGYMERTEGDTLFVSARREDLERMRDMVARYRKRWGDAPLFRADKDNSSVGVGTLRQNLINLFTADYTRKEDEDPSTAVVAKQRRLPWLRDAIIRLKPPSFGTKEAATFFQGPGPNIPGCDLETLFYEYAELNPDQQKAVTKVSH